MRTTKALFILLVVILALAAVAFSDGDRDEDDRDGDHDHNRYGGRDDDDEDHDKDDGLLSRNFYKRSCPQVEEIVRSITWSKVQSNPVLGTKLLRIHYHDCFVRGCDASLLLDVGSTNEKTAGPNQSVSGFEIIDEIKAKLEEVCPGTVSCADIVALAARDGISFPFKRSMWDVPTGRRDGIVSLESDVRPNLPSPNSNFSALQAVFTKKGLNIFDLVTLSGAHTLGVAHCRSFSTRLYNFTGQGDTDPSLDPTYAEFLKKQCPNPASPSITVEMDQQSSRSFDGHYYEMVSQNKGLFQSDAALLTNPLTARIVRKLQSPDAFFSAFAKSVERMGAIEVLTGNAGQIRKQCRSVN